MSAGPFRRSCSDVCDLPHRKLHSDRTGVFRGGQVASFNVNPGSTARVLPPSTLESLQLRAPAVSPKMLGSSLVNHVLMEGRAANRTDALFSLNPETNLFCHVCYDEKSVCRYSSNFSKLKPFGAHCNNFYRLWAYIFSSANTYSTGRCKRRCWKEIVDCQVSFWVH